MILETPRLVLREFTHEDDAFVLRLLNEPSWLRFIGDRGVRTLPDARRYLDDGPRRSYARNGFGLWCIVPKGGDAPVGMCGLIRRDTLPDVDVGFAFLPEAWGRGYARESAAAVLDHARDVLGLRRILAITDPENAASIRVLERVGMRREGTVRMPGESIDLLLFGRKV
ncbi:MAG: acetyltransferase family protein [Anaeromyxobacteraceae bacterium]|nr:acetyltransferase family protein [Anaeromyxobacteraceae bacterium]